MLELGCKPPTAVVLGDVNFMLMASDFGDLAASMAILARFSLHMHRFGYL